MVPRTHTDRNWPGFRRPDGHRVLGKPRAPRAVPTAWGGASSEHTGQLRNGHFPPGAAAAGNTHTVSSQQSALIAPGPATTTSHHHRHRVSSSSGSRRPARALVMDTSPGSFTHGAGRSRASGAGGDVKQP